MHILHTSPTPTPLPSQPREQCPLILPQLLPEPLIRPNNRSPPLHNIPGIITPNPDLLHQIGYHDGCTPRHPCKAVYEHIPPPPLLLNKLKCLLKVPLDILILVIIYLYPQMMYLRIPELDPPLPPKQGYHSPHIPHHQTGLIHDRGYTPYIHPSQLLLPLHYQMSPILTPHPGVGQYYRYWRQQMSLEEQVLVLRERVRELESQTRQKQKVRWAENKETKSQGGEDKSREQETQMLGTLKEEINSLYLKNNALQLQVDSRNTTISTLQARISKLTHQGEYNKMMDDNFKHIEALMSQKESPLSIRVMELEEKVRIDKDIIVKLTEELQDQNKVLADVAAFGGEVSRLKSVVSSIQEEKGTVEGMLESAVNDTKVFKEKYHQEITKNNQYLTSLSQVKSQLTQSEQSIKSLEKQNAKLHEEMSHRVLSVQGSSRETRDTEMNTQPQRTPKKSGNFDSPSLAAPADKSSELLTAEINKKNSEIKELLTKIDEIQLQNNKLYGGIETIKRELDSKKQIEKVLRQNIQQQKSVIDNQRNTISNLQQQQSNNIQQYQKRVQTLSQKLSLYSIPQEKSKAQLDQSAVTKNNHLTKSKCKSNQNNEDHQQIIQEDVTDFPMLTIPNANINQNSKLSNSVDLEREDSVQRYVSPISPPGFISCHKEGTPGKPKVKRLEFEKLEKKFSSITCNDRLQQQQSSKREEYQTKTVSARGLKSARTPTPVQLKLGIKNILDNSVLLGKGEQFIEILIELIQQVELFSGYPYQDIIADLQKKKGSQKSAFNTNLMKQITQITQIRNQCQETIQHHKEEWKERVREKEQIINELRIANLKYQTSEEQMAEKIQKLEGDIQKSRKVESQKELISKQNLMKSQEIDPMIEKLKQQKAFLGEKLERYEESIKEYDNTKRMMYADNEKLKSELMYFKQELVKIDKWVEGEESSKKNKLSRISKESEELMDIMVQDRLIMSRNNRQLRIQLKDKEESLEGLVEEVDVLKQQLKERQNDLIQIGRQIHEINEMRSRDIKQEIQEERESVVVLKEEEVRLRGKLKEKEEMLIVTEKEILRQKGEIGNMQRLLNEEKEKNKSHLLNKREMLQEIGNQASIIQSLDKKLAFVTQEESYQISKSTNEFQQIMEKMFYLRKREKESKRPKINANMFKTASSARLENEHIPNQKLMKEHREIKDMLKVVTEEIYMTYSTLPLISNQMVLFEAETKEELLNQLKDIRAFAENYVRLKTELDSSDRKMEQIYVSILKRIIRNEERTDEGRFLALISDLKVGVREQEKLRDIVGLIFSNRELEEGDKTRVMHQT